MPKFTEGDVVEMLLVAVAAGHIPHELEARVLHHRDLYVSSGNGPARLLQAMFGVPADTVSKRLPFLQALYANVVEAALKVETPAAQLFRWCLEERVRSGALGAEWGPEVPTLHDVQVASCIINQSWWTFDRAVGQIRRIGWSLARPGPCQSNYFI